MVWCWRGYLSGARCRLAYGPADAHCHSLSLASVKSRLVLPFWYRLTRVVLHKGPLNGCVCVCHLPVSHACLHCAIYTTCKDIFSGIFCIHKQIIRADATVVYTVKIESVQYVLFYNVYMTAVWSNWACVSRFK